MSKFQRTSGTAVVALMGCLAIPTYAMAQVGHGASECYDRSYHRVPCTMGPPPVYVPPPPPAYQADYERGEQAFKASPPRYAEALDAYERALQQVSASDTAKRQEISERIASVKSYWAVVINNDAVKLLNAGNVVEALRELERAGQLDPSNAIIAKTLSDTRARKLQSDRDTARDQANAMNSEWLAMQSQHKPVVILGAGNAQVKAANLPAESLAHREPVTNFDEWQSKVSTLVENLTKKAENKNEAREVAEVVKEALQILAAGWAVSLPDLRTEIQREIVVNRAKDGLKKLLDQMLEQAARQIQKDAERIIPYWWDRSADASEKRSVVEATVRQIRDAEKAAREELNRPETLTDQTALSSAEIRFKPGPALRELQSVEKSRRWRWEN